MSFAALRSAYQSDTVGITLSRPVPSLDSHLSLPGLLLRVCCSPSCSFGQGRALMLSTSFALLPLVRV